MASALISYCGLYCGACSFKLAFETNNRDHIKSMPSYYDKLKDNPLEECPGCRLENKCGECKIRDCAIKSKVDFCNKCKDFPCGLIEIFSHDGKTHHEEILHNFDLLKEYNEEQWLEIMKNKWACKKCGKRMSWYHKECKC